MPGFDLISRGQAWICAYLAYFREPSFFYREGAGSLSVFRGRQFFLTTPLLQIMVGPLIHTSACKYDESQSAKLKEG